MKAMMWAKKLAMRRGAEKRGGGSGSRRDDGIDRMWICGGEEADKYAS